MISFIKKTIRVGYIFFFATIIQSCLVYKKTPVTSQEAIQIQTTLYKKVKTKDKRVFHMKRLDIKENQVYGSNKNSGELKKLGFAVEDIETIRLQNKKLSSVGNGFLIVGLLGVASWVFWVAVIEPKLDLNFGTFF